jgi:hypothetical protein
MQQNIQRKQLTPNYISININGKNLEWQKTMKGATQYHLNQTLKFLYLKNKKLNERLYRIHLECASVWHSSWHIIQVSVDNKIQQRMESHYNQLNKKLDNLQDEQRRKMRTRHINLEQQFYPRTINLTNIKFTKEEMDVINHGMQYSMEKPLKTYWTILLVETKRAIKLIDTKLQNPY